MVRDDHHLVTAIAASIERSPALKYLVRPHYDEEGILTSFLHTRIPVLFDCPSWYWA